MNTKSKQLSKCTPTRQDKRKMLVKLQHLDTTSTLCKFTSSLKSSPTIGVSVPPPSDKQDELHLQLSKKFSTVCRRNAATHVKNRGFTHNPSLSIEDYQQRALEGVRTNCSTKWVRGHGVVETVEVIKNINIIGRRTPSHDKKKPVIHNPCSTSEECKVNVSPLKMVEKIYTNCSRRWVNERGARESLQDKRSTKWACYGGCIPAILEVLDKVNDLDEAFTPWEERLGRKELTVILKEQRNWVQAMEIFEWFKRKGCYEVNVIHYNVMFRILGKARNWGEVERLWAEMEMRRIMPVSSTFGTLIDVYSKGELIERAIQWLELMSEEELEPDEITMNIVVHMYKKAGEFENAEKFFNKWSARMCLPESARDSKTKNSAALNGDCRAHVGLSSYTYNTLIDTYGKAGRLKDASDTFEMMLRQRIVPNIVTFNSMIHIFGNHSQLYRVRYLMMKMEQLKCQPDTRTYNILIFLHAKHDSIETAAGYFKKMKADSLEPDPVSYRTLLYAFSIRKMVSEAEELVYEMDKRSLEIDEYTQSALTRMYIESSMLDKSWLWFKRFHHKGNMTSECYSANIDAFGERGHVLEAEKVFRCCQEERNPSVLEYNVMIKAYGINKRYNEACHLFNSMDKNGIVPDKCSYSSLIQFLASAGRSQTAMHYARKMQKSGLVSDCIVYCAVISSFIKSGQLETAVEVFKEMIGFGVQPDVVVYGVLINAYADIGNVEEALSHLSAMKERGLLINDVIIKSLIKLYTKVGLLKEAEEAYYMLQKLDEGPDLYSSNCLIDLYTEKSMVKEAEDIFKTLRTSGAANEFSYAMMLCMYRKIRWFKNALQIAKKMRELGLLTELLSYNHVLGVYACYGRFKEVVTTLNEMIECGLQPDDSTLRAIGNILVKRGVSKQAIGKLEVMWKRDSQSGLEAWMSTLNSVLDNVDHDLDE